MTGFCISGAEPLGSKLLTYLIVDNFILT